MVRGAHVGADKCTGVVCVCVCENQGSTFSVVPWDLGTLFFETVGLADSARLLWPGSPPLISASAALVL